MTTTVEPAPELGFPDDGGDPVVGYLSEMLVALGGLAAGTGPADDAARVDRIAALERLKAAAAAAQATEILRFARSQVSRQRKDGVNYRRLGEGIAEQIGLATKLTPWHGNRKLHLARDLTGELPATFDLLTRGGISEYVAQLVASETSHLDPDTRRQVDRQLIAGGLTEVAPRQAAGLARRLAYAADPESAVKRARKARADRRVSLRPAPDTMAWFSALLPVEDGVACLAALTRHADQAKAAGDPRTRGQIMADATVERLSGHAVAEGPPVEVNLTMPLEHLLNPDDTTPADMPGFGPIPAGIADDLLHRAADRISWRRLFTAPTGPHGNRIIVGGDPTVRRFTGWLAKLLKLRDGGICREPYCGAPIRHLDHIIPYRDGGPTSYANGRGVCERHNQTREMPDWQVELLADRPHTVITVTPTGHTYFSQAARPAMRFLSGDGVRAAARGPDVGQDHGGPLAVG